MKLEFFKPNDFREVDSSAWGEMRSKLARMANELLNAALGAKVHSRGALTTWTSDKYYIDTHEAFIFNIQPIKKKCGHTEIFGSVTKYLEIQHKCLQCGAILKPTGWVEV